VTEEQREAFLSDYKKLIEKHGIYVGACGCCDSPWIVTIDYLGKTIEEIIEHCRMYHVEKCDQS